MIKKIRNLINNQQRKQSLKINMIGILLLGWLLPLMLLTLCMLIIVSNRMNRQFQTTVQLSADKAIEICQMRLEDAMTASRRASYLPDVKKSYSSYLRTGDKDQLYSSVTEFLEQHYKYNENFLNTVLYFKDAPNQYYFTYRSNRDSTYMNLMQLMESSIAAVQQKADAMGTEISFMQNNGHILMVRNIVDADFKPMAVLVMEIDPKVMFGSLISVWGYKNCDVYLGKNSMLASSLDIRPDKSLFQNRMQRSQYGQDETGTYVYQVKQVEKQKITYLVELDRKAIVSELDAIMYIFILMAAFMVPLIFLVLWFFRSKITRPVDSLIRFTDIIKDGQYGKVIPDMYSSKEFYYLGQAFNRMSRKLQYQFEQIYLEELALRDAKIMALQSQINPHFLNNTLEIINWEARRMDNYKVSSMIEALSTMLEATMNRKKQQLIPLSEELSYVDAYLLIISYRFGEKFQVVKEIDNDLLRVEVPRLIIQPIIENAVEHGMNLQMRGKVSIRIYAVDDKMKIEITDNGTLTPKDLERIEKLLSPEYEAKGEASTSLGIRNVDQRLHIIYGEDCGLSVKSNKEHHTVSTITVRIDKEMTTIKDNKQQR